MNTLLQSNHSSSKTMLFNGSLRNYFRLIDTIFAGYCLLAMFIVIFAWQHHEGHPAGIFILIAFMLVNGFISWMSRKIEHPMRAETLRALTGAVLAPASYLLVGAPLMRWWPGFLIMGLGGVIIVGLRTGIPCWGRLLTVYYFTLMVVTECLAPTPHPWYEFTMNSGIMIAVILVFNEVVALLGTTLMNEREQRRLLAEERAQSDQLLQKEAEIALRASEERFRTLIETSSDGVIILDNKGIYRYVSPAYEQIILHNAAELIGQTAFNLIHPDDLSQAHDILIAVMQGHAPEGFSTTIRSLRGDNQWRYLDCSGRLLPDGNLVAYVRDITARKHADEALRQLNAELEQRVEERTAESKRLAAILEATSDYVGIADMTGQMVYINRAGREMLGVPVDTDITRSTIADQLAPATHDIVFNHAMPQLLRAGCWRGEIELRHNGGQTIPVSNVSVVLPGVDGQPEFLAAINRNITEQKHAEMELKQARDAAEAALRKSKRIQVELLKAKEGAEAASRAKSTFLANMSHEIRTPMNAVIGMTSLLLNMPLNEKQRDMVSTIGAAGDSLLSLINDILDFSKIEAGKLDLEHQPLNLRRCLESVRSMMNPRMADKGLEFNLNFDPMVPEVITGDINRLRQILTNLIGNAVKFTESGSITVTVSVLDKRDQQLLPSAEDMIETLDRCQMVKHNQTQISGTLSTSAELTTPAPNSTAIVINANPIILRFTVRDTGIGIPQDKMNKLFHSFTQLDASTTREYGGTGLGLAISKRLCELMGGEMWVESSGVGCGSTFGFTITTTAAERLMPTAINPIVETHNNKETLMATRLPLRILLAEDVAVNRKFALLALEDLGYTADIAVNGQEAITQAMDKGYDVILMDVQMPVLDGLDATRSIRSNENHHHRHYIIAMTANAMQGDREMCLNAGMDDYVSKPVYLEELQTALEKAGIAIRECKESMVL